MNTDDIRNIIQRNLQDAMNLIGGYSTNVVQPLDEPLQVIYYGAPGTGKSHLINNHKAVTDDNTIRTTFHPDSDYSTFVGAYKPTMDDVPVNAIVGTNLHRAKYPTGKEASEKKIVYRYVPQAFLKAYVEAWSDLDKPHFLVIEEINRGNCAQIFGDLFQLLDRNNDGCSTYAIHADDDIAKFLGEQFGSLTKEKQTAISNYKLVKERLTELIGPSVLSGKKLLLPHNLYIWATMNTSDQSLFPIDSAFKRRWDWVYIPIDYEAKDWQFEVVGHRYLWSDFLKAINPQILDLTMSADKQMGFFFAKPDKKTAPEEKDNNLITERVFLNKVLFYLWTDVLKDFEPNNDIFRDSETGRTYQFDKFFTDKQKLAEFVGKLGLKEVGVKPEEPRENDHDEADVSINSATQNSNSGYVLNGEPVDSLGQVMQKFVSVLAPKMTFDELETLLYNELNINRFKAKGGIMKGDYRNLNAPDGVPTKARFYTIEYKSKDNIIFALINGWAPTDESKILHLVNSDKVNFPQGVQKA